LTNEIYFLISRDRQLGGLFNNFIFVGFQIFKGLGGGDYVCIRFEVEYE